MEAFSDRFNSLFTNKTLVIGKRGAGKTSLLIELAAEHFLKGNFRILIIDKDYSSSLSKRDEIVNLIISKSGDDKIISKVDKKEIASEKINSIIAFGTSETHKMRGYSLDVVLLDNIDLYDFYDCMVSIYPCLATNLKSKIIATSTSEVDDLRNFNKVYME